MTARRRGKGEGSVHRRASDGLSVAALIMDDGRRVVRRASSRKNAAARLELRWGLAPRNVVALVRPPRKMHVEVVALTVEETRALLAAAASTRFEVMFILALKTGGRTSQGGPRPARTRAGQHHPGRIMDRLLDEEA